MMCKMTARPPEHFPAFHATRGVLQRTSLVTFADMVMALDHTYASGKDSQTADSGCVLRKNDHTYSSNSRQCRLSCVSKVPASRLELGIYSVQSCPDQTRHSTGMFAFTRKSSSEENLSRARMNTMEHHGLDWNSHITVAQKSYSVDGMCTLPNSSARSKSTLLADYVKNARTNVIKSCTSCPHREDHTYATLCKNRALLCEETDSKSEHVSEGIVAHSTDHHFSDHTYDKGLNQLHSFYWCQALSTFTNDHNYHSCLQRDFDSGQVLHCNKHSNSTVHEKLSSTFHGNKACGKDTFGFSWITHQECFTSFDHNYSTSV